ncbi:ATP-binding protein [Streptomyces sp. NBC_01435]|uniref:ATP-binding protein n=1 Tax=Streptomyces sp. NBC_01435 TaxID=2903865 RepID=UPI002E2F2D7F|nr:ATP-binding protein [Streptomyces sp. NBC_01435]
MNATTETEPPHYRHELYVHPQSLAQMRRIVACLVDLWDFRELTDAAALCAHELLTNVGRHTPSPRCTLTLRRRTDGVRITVGDSSPTPPTPRAPDWTAESGRGLALIGGLAANWGSEPAPYGKDVWADLRSSRRRSVA